MQLTTVKQYFSTTFADLRPLEKSEVILLALFVIIYPFSWQLALWAGLLLIVNAAVRMTTYRCHGNDFSKLSQWALWLLPALYLLYLVSMAYSYNTAEGLQIMFHKLPMILFPLYFLVGGLRFLSRKILIMIGYSFAFSCTALSLSFIFSRLCAMIFSGASFNVLFATGEMVPHHTYSAMYFLLSMTFLYLENRHHGAEHSRGWNITTWACIAFLIAITYFIQSRSGIICLIVLVLWALYDITFNRKKYALGISITGAAMIVFISLNLSLGDSHNRLNSTMKELSAGNTEDVRFEIWGNALQVIKKNPLFGIGVGDRMEVLEDNHERNFLTYGKPGWHPFNPHNQFLDTWVAIGICGLLMLIAIFILPTIYAFRCRPYRLLLLTLMGVAFVSSLVESTLERQMGVMFFCFAYGILQLPAAINDSKALPGAKERT